LSSIIRRILIYALLKKLSTSPAYVEPDDNTMGIKRERVLEGTIELVKRDLLTELIMIVKIGIEKRKGK